MRSQARRARRASELVVVVVCLLMLAVITPLRVAVVVGPCLQSVGSNVSSHAGKWG